MQEATCASAATTRGWRMLRLIAERERAVLLAATFCARCTAWWRASPTGFCRASLFFRGASRAIVPACPPDCAPRRGHGHLGLPALLPREEILQTVELPFRDRAFPCPRGYDRLLRAEVRRLYRRAPDGAQSRARAAPECLYCGGRTMDIDFVLPWVDGDDPAWRAERARCAGTDGGDASDVRYRDWGTLQYWFRAVDRFAPVGAPRALYHLGPPAGVAEYGGCRACTSSATRTTSPREYLPTFSSHPIELNMHRIDGPCRPLRLFQRRCLPHRAGAPEDFFRKGLPRDTCRFSVVHPRSTGRHVRPHTGQQHRRAQPPHQPPHVPQAARPQVVQPEKRHGQRRALLSR